MSIIETFPVPLYHGTCSLFIENIKKFGLNGKNQLEDYNLFEIMQKQFDLATTHLQYNENWQTIEYTTNKMVNQESMQWSHCRTYLSASSLTASRYAKSNRYGSEILTRCIYLQYLLESNNIYNEFLQDEFKNRGLYKICESEYSPILIRLNEVKLESIYPFNYYTTIEEAVNETKRQVTETTDLSLLDTTLQQQNYIIKESYTHNNFEIIELYSR